MRTIKINATGRFQGNNTYIYDVFNAKGQQVGRVEFVNIVDLMAIGISSFINEKIYNWVADAYTKRLVKNW